MSIDVDSEGLRLLLDLLRTFLTAWSTLRPQQQTPRIKKKQRRSRRRNAVPRTTR